LIDAFAIADRKAHLLFDALPEFEQRFLRRLAEAHLADERQRDGRRHHELGSRILEDAAAERVLLDRAELHTMRHGGEGCREPGRAGADDQEIEGAAIACLWTLLVDRVHGQPAL
jgi:hypothetical protein